MIKIEKSPILENVPTAIADDMVGVELREVSRKDIHEFDFVQKKEDEHIIMKESLVSELFNSGKSSASNFFSARTERFFKIKKDSCSVL